MFYIENRISPKSLARSATTDTMSAVKKPQSAQQFVVIGSQLKRELEIQNIFTDYFNDKQEKLIYLDDIIDESFNPDKLADITFTLFIIRNFDDEPCFEKLKACNCSIMGHIALLQTIRSLSSKDETIRMVRPDRPLHNLAMKDCIITLDGISSTREAQNLLDLTRYMGAKSRGVVSDKTTHLVARDTRVTKYKRALELGQAIMCTDWVRESYQMAQDDLDFEANSPEMIQQYKLKPFHGLRLAFVGFKDDDLKELCELTLLNGGLMAEVSDLSCTHIVVDAIIGSDDTNADLSSVINQNISAYVVYREWFWASLEMEGKANEETYTVPGYRPPNKRASKRASGGYNSLSNVLSPMLDYSRSPTSMCVPDHRQISKAQSVSSIIEEIDMSKITARHRACLELLQTERNYVRILETIVTIFKQPLENPETLDPVLPMTEVKIIFGNLTPIYEVHKRMLEDLEQIIEVEWSEANCIGKVFVSHSIELLKAYPPFVNFFEDTKKTINNCDIKYPRFHAFLKKCQSKIECNRESLTEMLIRPVQRLPSIILIITELLKRTDDKNPDKKYLAEALESIRRVMNLINEDKRRTEGQIAMFDIVNNIEDCPPNLLSALRKFVCKAEASLLFMNNESEVIPSKSHKVILFLFSDLIEICKVRSLKRSHSSKSSRVYHTPTRKVNAIQVAKLPNKKDYRHLDQLRLCDIMNIFKKCESAEMSEALVIQARPSERYQQNFRYYPFLIDDTSITKSSLIERLEECICTCDDPEQVSDYVPNNLAPISSREIDFGYANLLVNSMEKSRLSRVLSIRQALRSPSLYLYNHN